MAQKQISLPFPLCITSFPWCRVFLVSWAQGCKESQGLVVTAERNMQPLCSVADTNHWLLSRYNSCSWICYITFCRFWLLAPLFVFHSYKQEYLGHLCWQSPRLNCRVVETKSSLVPGTHFLLGFLTTWTMLTFWAKCQTPPSTFISLVNHVIQVYFNATMLLLLEATDIGLWTRKRKHFQWGNRKSSPKMAVCGVQLNITHRKKQ